MHFGHFYADSGLTAEEVEGNADTNSFTDNDNNSNSEIKDFRFICINNNNNTIIEPEEPIILTTASLTVKKQVFGCNNIPPIGELVMDSNNLKNNSTAPWIDCNNISISNL
ncbi:MAG TPA: hypothetical protein VFK40_11105 [Nitrososphaeraceae archaeon]|nr:hypothetical protein [Nitrososphaeraceae archaeon]